MAGRLTIQRFPKGLPGALAMKGTGDVPTELAPQILGVFDTTTLYFQDQRRQAVGQTAGGAPLGPTRPTSGTVIVPAGEFWIVTGMATYTVASLGAGITCRFRQYMLRQSNLSYLIFPTVTTGAALDWPGVGETWDLGSMVWNPGDTFGVWVEATAGAAREYSFCVDYVRVEI